MCAVHRLWCDYVQCGGGGGLVGVGVASWDLGDETFDVGNDGLCLLVVLCDLAHADVRGSVCLLHAVLEHVHAVLGGRELLHEVVGSLLVLCLHRLDFISALRVDGDTCRGEDE